jgi:molecular chaperone DnaK
VNNATEPVIGIDLGTTNSCVAMVIDGEVHVIPDESGSPLQASVVAFLKGGAVVVGNQAKQEIMIDPVNTVFSAKRLIGRSFDSSEVQRAVRTLPYRVIRGDDQQPFIEIRGERFGLPEVSGMVLRRMKDVAEAYIGRTVSQAVITVPANFNDTQRQMTKLAGELAGLHVLRVINEPTAAALAYGYGHDVNARVGIYDFGGGTFDVTILDIRENVFEVISTAGDGYLGGDDFDERLVRCMAVAFEQQHGFSIDGDPIACARLSHVAEKTKLELTETDRAIVNVQELTVGPDGQSLDLKFRLDRQGFMERCQDIVQRTFVVCDEALRGARMQACDLEQIVLVGGSTRIPMVREMVGQYFGRAPLIDINPDEVIAIGAAIQGAALAEDFFVEDHTKVQPLLLDVTPQSLGLASVDDYYEVLIERNAQIPCEQKQVFTTGQNSQTSVRIRIYQGEYNSVGLNTQLGEIELYGLRSAPRGEVKIEVTFEIDTDGIVVVRAMDLETGLEQATRMHISAGYSDEEIEDMRRRSGL